MAKFKQVPQAFIFKKLVAFWGNMVNNFRADVLDDEGKRLFFERMFKTELTGGEFAELKALKNLAPGDFRTVRQEQFYLDEEQTNRDRIAALKDECLLKKDGDKSSKIGFGA